MPNELKPCPCCGEQAVYQQVNIYLDTAWRVKCTNCKLQTMYEFVDRPNLTEKGLDESTRYTSEQAMQIVADAWNRRAGDD